MGGGETHINLSKDKKKRKQAVWSKKVARYLAYCVDGGLLQERFTLKDVIHYRNKLE